VKGDPEKTRITCAHPPAYTYIGVSVKLEKRLPRAWKFFMNWYLPIEEVSKFIADLEDIPGNPKKPAPEVAKRWVESHPEILKNWLTIYLASLTLEDIRGDTNLKRIQTQIKDAFNEKLFPDSKPQIEHVLFKEFAIQ